MNVVVAHQLLPLTVLGNHLFKSFLSIWCIKNFLCYDVIHVFLILVSYFFFFLLIGRSNDGWHLPRILCPCNGSIFCLWLIVLE